MLIAVSIAQALLVVLIERVPRPATRPSQPTWSTPGRPWSQEVSARFVRRDTPRTSRAWAVSSAAVRVVVLTVTPGVYPRFETARSASAERGDALSGAAWAGSAAGPRSGHETVVGSERRGWRWEHVTMGETDRPTRRTLRPGSSIAVGVVGAVAGLAAARARAAHLAAQLGAHLGRDARPRAAVALRRAALPPSSTTRASGSSTRCGSWTSRGRRSPRCARGGRSSSSPTARSTPPGAFRPTRAARSTAARCSLSRPTGWPRRPALDRLAAVAAVDARSSGRRSRPRESPPRSRPASPPTAGARGTRRPASRTRAGTPCRWPCSRRARLLRHRRLRPLAGWPHHPGARPQQSSRPRELSGARGPSAPQPGASRRPPATGRGRRGSAPARSPRGRPSPSVPCRSGAR